MKKIVFGLALVALCGMVKVWAVTQAHSLGVVSAIVESKTAAQVNALAAKGTGQLVYCSDCTLTRFCASSGTVAGAWQVATATGVFTAASYPHCQ